MTSPICPATSLSVAGGVWGRRWRATSRTRCKTWSWSIVIPIGCEKSLTRWCTETSPTTRFCARPVSSGPPPSSPPSIPMLTTSTSPWRPSRCDLIFRSSPGPATSPQPKLLRAGADRVVNPQQLGGDRMASFVTQPHVVDFVDVGHAAGTLEFRLEELAVARASSLAGRDAALGPTARPHRGPGVGHPPPRGRLYQSVPRGRD